MGGSLNISTCALWILGDDSQLGATFLVTSGMCKVCFS